MSFTPGGGAKSRILVGYGEYSGNTAGFRPVSTPARAAGRAFPGGWGIERGADYSSPIRFLTSATMASNSGLIRRVAPRRSLGRVQPRYRTRGREVFRGVCPRPSNLLWHSPPRPTGAASPSPSTAVRAGPPNRPGCRENSQYGVLVPEHALSCLQGLECVPHVRLHS